MRGLFRKVIHRLQASIPNCIAIREPPYAERHVRWCERSENENRKKTISFSSYSISHYLLFCLIIPMRYATSNFFRFST